MSVTPGPDAAALQGYGGFRLGALRLALPMTALREVVPCGTLVPLPCNAEGVIGGVDLRGVVVPVIDLARLVGHGATPVADPCAIIMVHQGRLLGLRADGVTSVFGDGKPLATIGAAGPAALLFMGCVADDGGTMFSVLSPDALARLPGVPAVDDPEPGRQQVDTTAAAGDAAAQGPAADLAVPMMLVRCGRIGLAIDALAVHTTLSDPVVRESVLAQGCCRGVVDCEGSDIPALDLLALCGLGQLDPVRERQAFVIAHDSGLVALLVDAVLDIVPVRPADRVALPAFAVQRAALFAGVLAGGVRPAAGDGTPFLLLDGAALRACDEVSALASIGARSRRGGGAAAQTDAARRPMLTFELGVETASPLEHVAEILPFTSDIRMFEEQGPTLGLLVHRGRSIPVLCLNHLVCGVAAVPTPQAGVLVVESAGELLGFAVPALKAIVQARWEPALPGRAGGSGDGRQALALVGEAAAERMLPVLDLQRLAASLQAQAQPVA